METKNQAKIQTQPLSLETSIGSKHFINQLEAIIIQIARCLAIEHGINVDPDAKEMTRQIIQDRTNSLLSKDTSEELKKLHSEVTTTIKTTKDPALKALSIKCYHLMKLTGLDTIYD